MKFPILVLSLLGCQITLASVPDSVRFIRVQRELGSSAEAVSWDRTPEGFRVDLVEEGKSKRDLLVRAKCSEVKNGFHCFIKPIKARGILTTNVNFMRTEEGSDLYRIRLTVLINGSFTAIRDLGKNFRAEVSGK